MIKLVKVWEQSLRNSSTHSTVNWINVGQTFDQSIYTQKTTFLDSYVFLCTRISNRWWTRLLPRSFKRKETDQYSWTIELTLEFPIHTYVAFPSWFLLYEYYDFFIRAVEHGVSKFSIVSEDSLMVLSFFQPAYLWAVGSFWVSSIFI